MKVTVLGGCPGPGKSSIGPNGMFIEVGGLNILVDFGAEYERISAREQRVRQPLTPPVPWNKIDFILLTHVHGDHCGLVPWIMSRTEKARLVTTQPTFLLAGPVWNDAHGIATFFGQPGMAPFSYEFYRRMSANRTLFVEHPGWVELANGVRAYFGSNGHIRGSAYVVLEHEGKRVVFSADVGVYDTPTVRGMSSANVPEEVRGADLLFLESTYGDSVLPSRESEIATMNAHVRAAIARGGKALTAALSVDRSANIALDQVAAGISPVYIDGKLTAEEWYAYLSQECLWSENDIPIDPVAAAKVIPLFERPALRRTIANDRNSYSIVSSAGSLQAGAALMWGKVLLGGSKNLLVQSAHQFDNTPGARIEQGERSVWMKDGLVRVEAEVLRTQASTHASSEKLAEVASWFAPKQVALYHGVWRARQALQGRLTKEGRTVLLPTDGTVIPVG